MRVSAIGLGAWQLGRSSHWPDGPDEAEAVRIVHTALDHGVSFIDTAPGYADGRSEPNIGRALAGRRRDEVVICTKFGYLPDGTENWSASEIEASVERSARRMNVDHVDIVVLHNPPPEILDGSRSDHYEVLHRLRDKGVIRSYGASVDWSADLDLVLSTSDSTAFEVRLSALYQEPWPAVGRARDRGAGTIVKVPLESGWLSGRYHADSVFAGVRDRWSREDVAVRAGLVDEFRSLLPAGVGVLAGALRFLLSYDAVSTVIPGTRSVAQLTSSIAGAADGPLPADTVAAIRAWYDRRLAATPLDW
ncbi:MULTISPECIES: aldo/keto reductase [unclassified Solwaraspora]|uniref:aldo/keto reductase n=1 Tax=unclassified Solwaraspora TaxID=2627926 RepID=UPI00248C9C05|nr:MULTISPECIES: aldo/keto reductase [unclassified Solwaraspora]WBB99355.1 aldo/keto reductase [Solwaraspora sp. WMMA2059]WBC22095.1 aldo/keto reductase [Solwaraspora sp. WMMA2080]WJK35861.1 aldo/keto reductase [Solwaraspora sp. WMMA2065]